MYQLVMHFNCASQPPQPTLSPHTAAQLVRCLHPTPPTLDSDAHLQPDAGSLQPNITVCPLASPSQPTAQPQPHQHRIPTPSPNQCQQPAPNRNPPSPNAPTPNGPASRDSDAGNLQRNTNPLSPNPSLPFGKPHHLNASHALCCVLMFDLP